MSRSREPGAAQRGEVQAVAPDLDLVKIEIEAEEYGMSQHGQEQAPLPDLSALKYEYEIEIEEHNLLQQMYDINCVKVEQGSQPGSSARPDLSVVKVEAGAQELGSVQGAEPQSMTRELLVKTKPFEFKEASQTAGGSSHSAIVGGIKIKIEEDCILYHRWKLFSSKVVLRDCAAELQQSGRYCPQCRVQFSSRSALTDHNIALSMLLTEASNNPNKIKCNLCKYTTCATKYSCLRRHMMRHTETKNFKCDHCQLSCASKGNLKVHMRIHTGVKPFKCDQCDYSTISKSNLMAHMRIHTGEKPYKCDQCQFSTARHDTLIIHKRTHTGEKPFKCNQCQYSSNSKSRLSVHMKAHTRDETYKLNQLQNSIIKRTTNHMNKKLYKCDQCLYSSTRRGAVALHKWTHKNPLRCNQYVNKSNEVLICEFARADPEESPGTSLVRPPITKTYSRLNRK